MVDKRWRPAPPPEPKRRDCTSIQAREIHRKARIENRDHEQFVTCWCCCFDCGFDHGATILNDERQGLKSVY
jgi:hypothetical protein